MDWLISWAISVNLPTAECHNNFDDNIGSGNGLVPSGNKPLPEPMLTQIGVAIWPQLATMS